jgi:septal ring factor EnvC (AmiA/AmiB activator)
MKPACSARTTRSVVIALLFACAALAADDDENLSKIKEQELEEVRDKISDLKLRMDETASDRDRLTGDLQEAELAIAERRQRLDVLERERAHAEKRRTELDEEIARGEKELAEESEKLAAQLRAAYMSGRQERLKLLLNQQDPATLGRQMAYYGYLNEYRSENIGSVSGRIRELASLRSAAAAEEARLGRIAGEQATELEALGESRDERQALLARLKERLAEEGRELERLAAEEKDLARLIAELSSILSDYPISSEDAFSEHKGNLTWPVAGNLLHDFGQPRGGKLTWNGVVLGAPQGREVRAVYHGRVVFADWLAGLGLLVIVDHGDGYLSLYGYNESVLKDAGDWVAPGDVIATVGDSGGQQQSALYFEIRHGTTPVNPRHWVTRRPGG